MTKVLLSHPPRPASHNSSRAMVWVRKNLFSSWSNSLLTIGCIWLMMTRMSEKHLMIIRKKLLYS